MQTLVLALLLAAVLSLFLPAAQKHLQSLLHRRRALVWTLPFLLTAIFAGAADSLALHDVRSLAGRTPVSDS